MYMYYLYNSIVVHFSSLRKMSPSRPQAGPFLRGQRDMVTVMKPEMMTMPLCLFKSPFHRLTSPRTNLRLLKRPETRARGRGPERKPNPVRRTKNLNYWLR